MKKLSLGIENFKKLMDRNAYYIDKTQLIVDCINEECVLYTSPRRFGKTLNMSMLYYSFSNEVYQIYYLHFDKFFGQYQDHHRQELFDALVKGEEEKANDILNGVFERSMSYYDNQESFYHGFLTGLFSGGYNVESNKELGDGRFDVCVLSKSPRKPAVIIEW